MATSDIINTVITFLTLLSLILVVYSLKQTRQSINAATYQHILDREADNWNLVRASSTEVKARALQHFGIRVTEHTFTPEMDVLMDRIGLFNFYEGIFFLNQQKALNKAVWDNWYRSLIFTMKNESIRKQWEQVKHVYNPLFEQFVAKEAPLLSTKQQST